MPEVACCADRDTGEQLDKCTCLEDNSVLLQQHVGKGSCKLFHWQLRDLSLVDVEDESRASLKIVLSPCWGSMNMYMTPLKSPSSVRKMSWFNASADFKDGIIITEVDFSDYYISVCALEAGNFTIQAATESLQYPFPGDGGKLELLQVDRHDVHVRWTPSDSVGVQYAIRYLIDDEAQPQPDHATMNCSALSGPCGSEIVNFYSACGVLFNGQDSGIDLLPWKGRAKTSALIRGLPLNMPVVVNIVATAPSGLRSVYLGERIVLRYSRVISVVSFDISSKVLLSAIATVMLTTLASLWLHRLLHKHLGEDVSEELKRRNRYDWKTDAQDGAAILLESVKPEAATTPLPLRVREIQQQRQRQRQQEHGEDEEASRRMLERQLSLSSILSSDMEALQHPARYESASRESKMQVQHNGQNVSEKSTATKN